MVTRPLSLGELNAMRTPIAGAGSQAARRLFGDLDRNVILDENGLWIKSTAGIPRKIKLSRGASIAYISVDVDGNIEMSPGDVGSGKAVIPISANLYDLGKSTVEWANVYTRRIYGNGGIRIVHAQTRTALQAAIDDVEAANGGTIFVPQGTYLIDSPLLLDADVPIKIFGYGASLVADAANLEAVLKIDRNNGDTSKYLNIEGFIVDGSKATRANNRGIRIVDTDKVHLKNIRIVNCDGEGLDLYIGTTAGSLTSWIEGCSFDGIQVQSCVTGVRFNRGARGDYSSCFGNYFGNVNVGDCTTGWKIDQFANLTRCVFRNTVTHLKNNQTGWDIDGDMREVQADIHVEDQGTPTNVIGVKIGANFANITRWQPHFSFVGTFTTKIQDTSDKFYPTWLPFDIMGWDPLAGFGGAGIAPAKFSSGTSGNDYSGWKFGNDGPGHLRSGVIKVPDDYVGDNLIFAVDMLWTDASAVLTGNVKWAIHIAAILPDNATYVLNHTESSFSVTPALTVAVPGTRHMMKRTVWTFEEPLNVRRGDALRINVIRDGADAADTATGDIVLVGLGLSYKKYG